MKPKKLVCYKCGIKRGYKKAGKWPPFMTSEVNLCPDCNTMKILVPERLWK